MSRTPTIDRWQAGFRTVRDLGDRLEREIRAECAQAEARAARARLITISPTLARQVWPQHDEEQTS